VDGLIQKNISASGKISSDKNIPSENCLSRAGIRTHMKGKKGREAIWGKNVWKKLEPRPLKGPGVEAENSWRDGKCWKNRTFTTIHPRAESGVNLEETTA